MKLKRFCDIILVVFSLPILGLILILLALVVRWKMGKPVFFVQTRTGLGGRLFRLIKFRTMTDAKGIDGKLMPDEDRLTSFGRWLRSTSFDEVPTLWNVLKGDMSFVGPRPLLPEYLPLYSPRQARRHKVPPGITGWAQISGRNALSWLEKFELDVWYVDNQNFILDCRILLSTIGKVLARDGIYGPDGNKVPPFKGTEGR